MKSKKEIQQIRELNELQSTTGSLGMGNNSLMGLFLNTEERNDNLMNFKDSFKALNKTNQTPECVNSNCFSNSSGNGSNLVAKNSVEKSNNKNNNVKSKNEKFEYNQNNTPILDEEFYTDAFDNLKGRTSDVDYNIFYTTYNGEGDKIENYPEKLSLNSTNNEVNNLENNVYSQNNNICKTAEGLNCNRVC